MRFSRRNGYASNPVPTWPNIGPARKINAVGRRSGSPLRRAARLQRVRRESAGRRSARLDGAAETAGAYAVSRRRGHARHGGTCRRTGGGTRCRPAAVRPADPTTGDKGPRRRGLRPVFSPSPVVQRRPHERAQSGAWGVDRCGQRRLLNQIEDSPPGRGLDVCDGDRRAAHGAGLSTRANDAHVRREGSR
jgi:hypothetical protein